MGKGKDPKKKPQSSKKDKKKSTPKKKSFLGKIVKFLLLLGLVVGAGGVGHFYSTENRLPKNARDAKVIVKNVSTFFIKSTNVAKEKWKELGMEKKTDEVLAGFKDLLEKEKSEKSSNVKGKGGDVKSPPKAVIQKPDPANVHIKSGMEKFEEGVTSFKKYRDSRSKKDLDKAKKSFQASQKELEKAKSLTSDPQKKQAIDDQLNKVGKYIADCVRMGGM